MMALVDNWEVLVVEDEPDGQLVIAGILDYLKVPVDAVGTAEEALEALERKTYTCVVIDLALPGMDGVMLIEKIRSNPAFANLPCVAITAYHTSLVKQQSLEAGFNAYFSKPIDDMAFVNEISRLLMTHSS